MVDCFDVLCVVLWILIKGLVVIFDGLIVVVDYV